MSEQTIQKVSRFEQNGQTMFVGVMRSLDIILIAQVDVRDEKDNPSGYQRYREERRCRRIAEFTNQPTSVLPGSILLNSRGSSTFSSTTENGSQGTLIIPKRRGAKPGSWTGSTGWVALRCRARVYAAGCTL